MNPPNTLLSGVVGSTAYGLAGPDSDVDYLGTFATPTQELHGLQKPTRVVVGKDPDRTFHEVGRYCTLALGGNPTILELLWLESHQVITELGAELIGIRMAFLSASRVRDAYLGYATSQLHRLEVRGDGSFSADTRNRTAKHARHLARLCHQGYQLYAAGELPIRLAEPQSFIDFGERAAGGDFEAGRALLREYHDMFDQTATVLPAAPSPDIVEDWLLRVRAAYYTQRS